MNSKVAFVKKRMSLALTLSCCIILNCSTLAKAGPEIGEREYSFYSWSLRELSDPKWQPNGEWIVFTRQGQGDGFERNQKQNIFKARFDGTEMIQLTTDDEIPISEFKKRKLNGIYNENPLWSRDGLHIGFTYSIRPADFWEIDSDGKNIKAISKQAAGRIRIGNWSPDSQKIAFVTSRGDGIPYIGIMDAADGEELYFVSKGYNVDWHPEGKSLLIEDVANKEDKFEGQDFIPNHLYEFDIATRKRVQITFGKYDDTNPSYSPDGNLIVFKSIQRGKEAKAGSPFCIVSRDGKRVRSIALHDPEERNWQYSAASFSSDGKQIVFARGQYLPTDIYTCKLDGSDLRRITKFYPDGLPPMPADLSKD